MTFSSPVSLHCFASRMAAAIAWQDMTYMTSTASNTGDASINIYFKQGTNADMAAVNVQNRVNGALSQLPAEATKTGVTTEKQQNAELMTFALYSPDDRFDQTFLNKY